MYNSIGHMIINFVCMHIYTAHIELVYIGVGGSGALW